MADLTLDILVIETYNKLTLGIADISTYPVSPPVSSPTITIEIPNGFGSVSLPFTPNTFNVFNSLILGLSSPGDDLTPLPDGVYTLTYSVTPSSENFVTKTFQRTNIIQEKFDDVFMGLEMMQCDRAIKLQAKVDLTTIYFFIEGSKAAANECAIDTANTLYRQADRQICNFIANNCGCSRSNNFITNFI